MQKELNLRPLGRMGCPDSRKNCRYSRLWLRTRATPYTRYYEVSAIYLRAQTLRRSVSRGPSAAPSGGMYVAIGRLSAARGGRTRASLYALPAAHHHGGRGEREGNTRNVRAKHGPGQTMCVACNVATGTNEEDSSSSR